MLASPRRASVTAIVAAIVVYVVGIIAAWWVLFGSPWLAHLTQATHGLVQPTLVATTLILLLVGAVFAASHVSPADVGLTTRDVPDALGVLLFLYVGLQLALVVIAAVSGHGVHASTEQRTDAGGLLGRFLSQVLVLAPVEEMMFRGFLLRQLLLRTRERFTERRACAIAVAGAALVFALIHVPQHLHLGIHGWMLVPSLAGVWGGGVAIGALYLRSGNLAIVMVLHALFNESAPLVAAPVSAQLVLAIPGLAVLIWIELRARNMRNSRGQQRL